MPYSLIQFEQRFEPFVERFDRFTSSLVNRSPSGTGVKLFSRHAQLMRLVARIHVSRLVLGLFAPFVFRTQKTTSCSFALLGPLDCLANGIAMVATVGKANYGDILLLLFLWSASRSQRGIKTELRSSYCLPISISEWSAASKTVSQGLEFGFCFHPVDMASPLSGLQDRSVAQQSFLAASNRRFQDGPLPVQRSIGAWSIGAWHEWHCGFLHR